MKTPESVFIVVFTLIGVEGFFAWRKVVRGWRKQRQGSNGEWLQLAPTAPSAQVLTLTETNRGPDDDGNLVVCYALRRGDDTLVATLQSTDVDVAVFPGAATSRPWVVQTRQLRGTGR